MGYNIQKIIDTISGALSFFDFSFIVSGSVTYGAICYYLWQMEWLIILDGIWLEIFISVVFIYVSGLVSFILGKRLRVWILKKRRGKGSNAFKHYYLKIEKYLSCCDERTGDVMTEEQLKLKYTKMWAELRECEECEKTIVFINRFWVMQAVCEGLLLSSIVIIIVGGLLMICHLCCNGVSWEIFLQYLLLIITGSIGAIAFYKEGRRYAESQIEEVIIAYYKYIK